MKSKLYCCCTILVALCMVGCSKEEENKELYNPMDPSKPFVSGKSNRTIFAYMAGDNDLYYHLELDTKEMSEGMKKTSSSNNLICLVDRPRSNTQLWKIESGERYKLEEYVQNYDSADPELFRNAFDYTCSKYSNQSYGLILWDHGSGWLPGKVTTSKAFAQDATSKDIMNLEDIVKALKDYHFDFIIFDACLMASVELLYELRSMTDYFLVSSMSTAGDGFPYDDIVPYLFVDNANVVDGLESIAYYYCRYYEQNNTIGYTMSLVSSNGFEQLKNEAKALNVDLNNGLKNNVQVFSPKGFPIYDFLDAYTKASPSKDVSGLKNQLESMVLYNEYSKSITEGLYKPIQINTCCGITTYLPYDDESNLYHKYRDSSYKATSWYKDTH